MKTESNSKPTAAGGTLAAAPAAAGEPLGFSAYIKKYTIIQYMLYLA